MTKKILLLCCAIAALALSAAAQSYRNPILGGDYPDPTVVRDGEDYYMTHSAFDYQPGLTVFHSRDLVHWEPISCALNTYLGSIWAPDISKYDGKFYIYFTVAHPNGRQNFVTWAESPYGPWSDPIDLHIGNIDPCHVVGEDGTRWLFLSAGKRARLTDDGLAIVPGTEEVVYSGWIYPEEWLTEGLCLEGPKLRKIGEYYYYLNAEGGTAGPPTSHMITVARSRSINGPWENSPYNPLVHTYKNSDRWWSKGHGSLIDTPDGRWWVIYHSYENGFYNLGRQTLMEPVEMTPDGWFKTCDDTDIEGEIRAPLPFDTSVGDRYAHLDEFRLGLDWKFYKHVDRSRVQVGDKCVTLRATGGDMVSSPPMLFVAGQHAYEVEARITLEGNATAGITLYYNGGFFMSNGFNRMGRIRHRMGQARGGGRHPQPVESMWIRIRNDRHIVTGEYSYDGRTWQRETWGMDISGYHHNTLYDFQSVLPGLFVYGEGAARFEEFKFTILPETNQMKSMKRILICGLWLSVACVSNAFGRQPDPEQRILDAMKQATHYMMDVASYRGGFVWNYLPDLSRTWGEMEAKRTMVWIQPPGTPSVGHLMLDAYHATGDEYYYECAEKVAAALIWGQQPCGGWNYMFDFAGENSTKEWYATVGKSGWRLEEFQHYYGNSTFDDGGTMEAAKFLLRIYVEKYDPAYRPALEKAIRLVLESQYPVGGWPQRWPLMYDHPFQGKADYSSFITLNDDVIPDNIDFLVQCYQALGMQNLKEPILRAMNCVIILQQGAPYAGWGDQYTVSDLQPAHARSYEPRAINTATTMRMVRALMDYYRLTGDTKYLTGIPAALDFVESLRLPASEVERWGRPSRDPDTFLVPRFIDPDDGRPLYVHRRGTNVFNGAYYIDQDISNTIAHYSSAAYVNVKAMRKAYEELCAMSREEATAGSPLAGNELVPLEPYYYQPRPAYGGREGFQQPSIDELVSTLTAEGYWLSPIRQISNPYKPAPAMEPSNSTAYMQTMVGDEYDTSPYTPETPVMGISTQVFINNMTRLIHEVKK